MGKLLQEVPKAKNQHSAVDSGVYGKVKEETGISQKQAQRFQTLAKHPEEVERANENGHRKEMR